MERNEANLQLLNMHKDFEIKTKKMVNLGAAGQASQKAKLKQQVPRSSYLKVEKLIQKKFVEE